MSRYIERYQRRKLLSSYFSVVLSIALVLFLLGALGVLVLNAKKLADHFKEQITFSVFLKDTAKPVEVEQLQKGLTLAAYTKSAEYIAKADAAEQYSEAIGENFVEFLGYNPLRNAIDLHLKADFVSPKQMAAIAEEVAAKTYVEEVSYDAPLVALLTEKVQQLSLWILGASAAFTLIAVLLINSSIRLSIYSKRFIIKTMQLVGATKRFIRKPFLWKNVKLGLLGATLALLALGSLLYYADTYFPQLRLLRDVTQLAVLGAGVYGLGALISWASTYRATQRFLNVRTDDLY